MEIIKKKVSGSKLRVEGLRRRTDEAGLNCLFKGCLGAKSGEGVFPPGRSGSWISGSLEGSSKQAKDSSH